MVDVKEAKHIERLEKNLIRKFRDAEKEECQKRAAVEKVMSSTILPPVEVKRRRYPLTEDTLPPPPPLLPPASSSSSSLSPKVNTGEITVEEAKRLEATDRQLQHDFAAVHAQDVQDALERERKYETITKAIREEKRRAEVREEREKELRKKQKFNQLMKFRPRIASTPARPNVGYIGGNREGVDDDENDDDSDRMEVEEGEPQHQQQQQQQQNVAANQSLRKLMDTKVVTLGLIGSRYFPRANDPMFGIWYDEQSDRPKIGGEPVTFDHDDIILTNDRTRSYKGTEGLWRLLTRKNFVEPDEYTSDDWKAYKELLVKTRTMYQRNDPNSGRPKSSQGVKWKRLIKPVWEEYVRQQQIQPSGAGLAVYNGGEKPVEYRYIHNLNELINRLNFISAQESAGNDSFHNEKLALVRFVHDRMEELIGNPNGTKYLVRCLSALPESVVALRGSGLLNDIINKLPFELHAPRNWNFDTYNYCGPGTRLDQRLARGDRGINPLDEACKRHDIWYRDHKNTEDRWVADKELQKAAWDRVKSVDADLNERAVALATTGGMWLKRKLGMGLGTSTCLDYRC